MNKLILGDGLLGTYLNKSTGWEYVSRGKNNFDFTDINTYQNLLEGFDVIINCIGNAKPYGENRDAYWNVNYGGVVDLVDFCNISKKKIVHISSDYVYSYSDSFASEQDVPVHCKNWYGYTKLLADGYIELKSNDFLIFRTSFKERDVEYKYGWMQFGNFDFVDVIGNMMIKLIEKNISGVYNLGTDTKTLYDLFLQTNKDIEPTFKFTYESTPSNVTMNLGKIKGLE
tara:strand:+ start:2182 stop:2865 length:684 start_codon:yes stop_codon:yes gene_type:complete